MNNTNLPRKNSLGLSKEQKAGFIFLLVFAVLAVSLGVLQMRNTIYNPFVIKSENKNNKELIFDENTRLQQIDTDQDGISDYDEINFYETSAYISDTDSDGIDDKTEIEKGTDPLCPKGEKCESKTEIKEENINIAEPLIKQFGIGTDLIDTVQNQLGETQQQAIESTIGDLDKIADDPAKIRELLLSTGRLDKAQLDEIDDVTLLNLAKEIIQAQKKEVEEQKQESDDKKIPEQDDVYAPKDGLDGIGEE